MILFNLIAKYIFLLTICKKFYIIIIFLNFVVKLYNNIKSVNIRADSISNYNTPYYLNKLNNIFIIRNNFLYLEKFITIYIIMHIRCQILNRLILN